MARARLSRHERWTRDELVAYQARRLAEVRSYDVARSPFYRERHRGLEDAPREALPSVTKATLIERFDDLVTDRAIRLIFDVVAYLTTAAATDTFRGRYRVQATGGTTGRVVSSSPIQGNGRRSSRPMPAHMAGPASSRA
jgi:phenylacetate-coenzyme A ligase PaaK-like adenylate-forming protein